MIKKKGKELRDKSEGIIFLIFFLFTLIPAPASHARNVILDMNKLKKDIRVDGTVDERKLQDAVSRLAYAPEEVKFRNTMLMRGVSDFPVLCGEVNILHHEAGAGWQRFVHAGDPLLEENGTKFERAWEKHCE